MREAIAALQSALDELVQAQAQLPDDLRAELAKIVERAEALLASLRAKSPD